mmetsp:Transcript_9072/g.25340  ORF Transcript_9072/g.25340 Transcript_9072/m.25340 type:complete len:106 (+) Transcript_9072:720-1037(+)
MPSHARLLSPILQILTVASSDPENTRSEETARHFTRSACPVKVPRHARVRGSHTLMVVSVEAENKSPSLKAKASTAFVWPARVPMAEESVTSHITIVASAEPEKR